MSSSSAARLSSWATSVSEKNRLPDFGGGDEKCLRPVGFAFGLGQFIQKLGLLHGLPGRLLTLGLQGLELRHVPVSGPLDALFINRQQIEIVGVFAPGSGVGESVIDIGVAGLVGRVLVHAEGERAGFDGAGALQAPAVVGDEIGRASCRERV